MMPVPRQVPRGIGIVETMGTSGEGLCTEILQDSQKTKRMAQVFVGTSVPHGSRQKPMAGLHVLGIRA